MDPTWEDDSREDRQLLGVVTHQGLRKLRSI